MVSYDSDSSGAEDDFTETTVLLGYASKEATEDTISQLGGYPVCTAQPIASTEGALLTYGILEMARWCQSSFRAIGSLQDLQQPSYPSSPTGRQHARTVSGARKTTVRVRVQKKDMQTERGYGARNKSHTE